MVKMKERPLQTDIIYGPVNSRRLGRSLGVNILPTSRKACTFNCLYCQYGWTYFQYDRSQAGDIELPTPAAVAAALEKTLPEVSRLDAITLAGNGEPTLHPAFERIAHDTARLRDSYQSGVPVCILSNSSTVDDPAVRAGLEAVDRKIMKLDAGIEETFQLVNRPRTGITLDKIVEGLVLIRPLEIQALFFDGPVSNAGNGEVAAWIELLLKIDPVAVQIYTLDRVPAEAKLSALSRERLEEIAGEVRLRLPGRRVEVY